MVAYAYVDGRTVKSVKFDVIKRPIPAGYVSDQSEELEEVDRRIELLENVLKDIDQNGSVNSLQKFETVAESKSWAVQNKQAGAIIVIRINGRWFLYSSLLISNYGQT